MKNDRRSPNQEPAGVSTHEGASGLYLDWTAIIAGGVFALGVAFLVVIIIAVLP